MRQLEAIANDHNARGIFHSGIHGSALADAKARALHQYRDEEWRARIDLARLRVREGAWHSIWRKVRYRPAPRLTVSEDIEPFLDRWREPVTRHGAGPADAATPLDRTRRTTAQALAELRSLKLT